MRTVFSVRYPHPVEQVFPYLAEPEEWLEFTPALVERTRIDDGPIKPGSMWKSADRVGPVTVKFTDELVALEPNRMVKWKQSAPWNSWAEYSFEADGDDTIINIHFEGRPTGKIWWLGFMPDRLATKVYQDDFELLGKVLDSTEKPAP
jgi:hypothetical protein